MSSVEKFLQSLIEAEEESLEPPSRSYFSVPDLEASFRKKISIACEKLRLDEYTRNVIIARAIQLPNYRYLSTRMIVITMTYLFQNGETLHYLTDLMGLTYDKVKPLSDAMGVTKIDSSDLLRAFFQYMSMFVPLAPPQ